MSLKTYILLVFQLCIIAGVYSCKSKQQTSQNSTTTKSKLATSEEDQKKFAFYFVDACKERMKGNLELAEYGFRECLKIDPASTAVKYELGNIYKYNRLFDNALKYAKECAQQEPQNEWYQLFYIECLSIKGQHNTAIDVYTKLIKNYPNRSDFYIGLAQKYFDAGNIEKSFKTYDEIEKKFGTNEFFTQNKIKLLKELNKTAEVEQELKKLISLNPEEIRYYTFLAEHYQETSQNTKAMETYQKALLVSPNNPMVHLAIADYYKLQNDKENFYTHLKTAFENPDLEVDIKMKILSSYFELSEKDEQFKKQAEELLDITLKNHASVAEVQKLKGDFMYRDNKLKEANDAYLSAVKLDKSSFKTWNLLLRVESELGNYKAVEEHSSEAMELFPNQALTYFFNGLANISLKNYNKAISSLNDGLEFVYNNNQLALNFYSGLGESYNAIKDYEKSDKAYDNALKIDPDNAEVLNNYAYFLSLRKDKLEKAEKFSRRSNEIAPNNRRFMDTYGWILYQQGKYSDAEQWLERAAKSGGNSTIIEHYGDVLFKLGKKEEAIQYWVKAKEAGNKSESLEKKISDKQLND